MAYYFVSKVDCPADDKRSFVRSCSFVRSFIDDRKGKVRTELMGPRKTEEKRQRKR